MKILNLIKEKLKSLKFSKFVLFRQIFKIIKAGYTTLKFFGISSYRNQTLSWLRYRKHFHQISHYTEANRYPDLFGICRDYFKEIKAPEILSFGCATGEEVFSLGEYLPNAKITGTDISKWCINECRKKNIDQRFTFLHSKSKQFELPGNFDAIFCLAVFQHPDNREESTKTATKYRFTQFEDQLIILDQKLNPGGLLFIDHCDFNFRETSLSGNYSPLKVEGNKTLRDRPIFDRHNRKIFGATYTYRVFVKNVLIPDDFLPFGKFSERKHKIAEPA